MTDIQLEETIQKYSTKNILTKNYSLEIIRKFLNFLDNPQKDLKFIHVGGTSGKGSTSFFLSSILVRHRLKVGTFMSPHVSRINERILLDTKEIGGAGLRRYAKLIEQNAREFSQKYNLRKLTYFEFLFALALVYFKEEQVDVAIIEVGLGGKLDPTNVLDTHLQVLTNVGLDHIEILGDTIEKIAEDKVQIVKPNSICVSGFKQPSVVDILENRIIETDSKLLLLDKEFSVEIDGRFQDGITFNYKYNDVEFNKLQLDVLGIHQLNNAALAITAAITYLKSIEMAPQEHLFKEGLSIKGLPGRIQVKSLEPMIIWDAAHNEDKMKVLVDTLSNLDHKRIVVLLACKKGKNVSGMLAQLKRLEKRIDKIVLTRFTVTQDIVNESEPYTHVYAKMEELFPKTVWSFESDPVVAYKKLLNELNKDQMLVVTGSFYLLSSLSAMNS